MMESGSLMTGRLSPAVLMAMRKRVANGEPVKSGRDTPDRWARLEEDRWLESANLALTRFLDLDRQLTENAETEVTVRTLAIIIGDDTARKGDKITGIFGPAQNGEHKVQSRVYLWREVRQRAHLRMVSRLIQRLAWSMANA